MRKSKSNKEIFGIIPEYVTAVLMSCRYARLHGSYLRTLCTTFLPQLSQLIGYQLVKYSASASRLLPHPSFDSVHFFAQFLLLLSFRVSKPHFYPSRIIIFPISFIDSKLFLLDHLRERRRGVN